jgi:hypothetical protein
MDSKFLINCNFAYRNNKDPSLDKTNELNEDNVMGKVQWEISNSMGLTDGR